MEESLLKLHGEEEQEMLEKEYYDITVSEMYQEGKSFDRLRYSNPSVSNRSNQRGFTRVDYLQSHGTLHEEIQQLKISGNSLQNTRHTETIGTAVEIPKEMKWKIHLKKMRIFCKQMLLEVLGQRHVNNVWITIADKKQKRISQLTLELDQAENLVVRLIQNLYISTKDLEHFKKQHDEYMNEFHARTIAQKKIEAEDKKQRRALENLLQEGAEKLQAAVACQLRLDNKFQILQQVIQQLHIEKEHELRDRNELRQHNQELKTQNYKLEEQLAENIRATDAKREEAENLQKQIVRLRNEKEEQKLEIHQLGLRIHELSNDNNRLKLEMANKNQAKVDVTKPQAAKLELSSIIKPHLNNRENYTELRNKITTLAQQLKLEKEKNIALETRWQLQSDELVDSVETHDEAHPLSVSAMVRFKEDTDNENNLIELNTCQYQNEAQHAQVDTSLDKGDCYLIPKGRADFAIDHVNKNPMSIVPQHQLRGSESPNIGPGREIIRMKKEEANFTLNKPTMKIKMQNARQILHKKKTTRPVYVGIHEESNLVGFTCTCSYTFTCKRNLTRHIRKFKDQYSCPCCGRVFGRRDLMKKHLKKVHINI